MNMEEDEWEELGSAQDGLNGNLMPKSGIERKL
jgi:hypothetical protein